MSAWLGLFYTFWFGNHVLCSFLLTFFELLFRKIFLFFFFILFSFFAQGPTKYKQFLNRSIWALTDTTIPDHSGPGSNGNKGVLHKPQISRIGASPSDTVFVIPRTYGINGRGGYFKWLIAHFFIQRPRLPSVCPWYIILVGAAHSLVELNVISEYREIE